MTKPSPSASSSARAKLWLPPVSSNGLNRTRPMRWNARRGRLERPRPGGQLVDLAGDRVDLVELGLEHRLEAAPVIAPGQAGEPALERRRARRTDDDDDEGSTTRRPASPTTTAPMSGMTSAFRSIERILRGGRGRV